MGPDALERWSSFCARDKPRVASIVVEQAEVVAPMAGKASGGVCRAMEVADRAPVGWRAVFRHLSFLIERPVPLNGSNDFSHDRS